MLPPLAALFVVAIGTRWAELASALFLGYAAIWVASFKLSPLRILTVQRDYSYGVYIFGVPVTQTIIQAMPSISITGLIVATIAITLPLAVLSWTFIEQPALAARKRLLTALRISGAHDKLRPALS